MTAYFIVRAEVDAEARDAFDAWYETEHLPDAVEALGAAAPRAAGAASRTTSISPSTSSRTWRR